MAGRRMPKTGDGESGFLAILSERAADVNAILQRVLAERTDVDEDLRRAMEYTLLAPGKRVRSVLVLWACEMVAGSCSHNAEIAAAAVEMVHTYSLVHDDLPAMDDDDFRRGRKTCHKAFGEATAILAGDALLTLAFEILGAGIDDAATAVKLVVELAGAAGAAGMVAGQMEDLRAEGMAPGEKALRRIHTNKTAKIFGCAAVMGGICGGADAGQLDALRRYGLKVGLGFQIADDVLDICASSEQLGKTAGKDIKAGKATYPAVVGLDGSKRLAERLCNEAVEAVESFGPQRQNLSRLASALLRRRS
jgi:geranylgeranyl pyrophosphate synthase